MWLFSLLACLGGMRHEVELADLAPLGAAELGALRDEEHAVSVALTLAEGAEAEVDRAEERVREARLLRDQERMEHKSALASLEAARASRDLYRIGAAEGAESAARRELDLADARLRWQEAARRAAEASVDLADARVELRTAELELARYELLAQAGRSVGYRRADFADQVTEAQAEYDDRELEHEGRVADAAEAWEAWRALERYPARDQWGAEG